MSVCHQLRSDIIIMATPSKKEDLDTVRTHFEASLRYAEISVKISCRRLRFVKKTSPFLTEDLVFTMHFDANPGTSEPVPVMGSLVSVYEALKELVEELSAWFDDSLRRYVSFSASMDGMTSQICTG